MTYQIRKKCRHVHDALSGRLGVTEYVRVTGKWRYIDIINVTGRNSSERKLRELIEECPGLVSQKVVKGKDGQFKVFWLTPSADKMQVTPGTDGKLFDMPSRGRPE